MGVTQHPGNHIRDYLNNFNRNSKFGYRGSRTGTMRKKVIRDRLFIWVEIRTNKRRDKGEFGKTKDGKMEISGDKRDCFRLFQCKQAAGQYTCLTELYTLLLQTLLPLY